MRSVRKKKEKQTVLWTIYHAVLVIELGILIVIEGIELFLR
tara:strand:+ start:55 stop:177 length:123 start_codon:yes stop_codon:yes gene_type:complete